MLVVKVDELVAMTTRDLDEIRAVTDQLEPDRAQSCRVVPIMAQVMLDEVTLRAAAGLLDEPAG
jgi:methionine synthase I (cobalamin-dependent)